MAGLIRRDLYFNKLCASTMISNKLRNALYRWGGVKLHKGVTICPHCFVGNSNLEIGEGTFINYNVWFNTAGGIEIGTKCNIAYKVTFVTSTHEVSGSDRRAGEAISNGIKIGDGTWIGANAIIMPGVHVGSGCIIAAGSVVLRDCEANCLYAGNPAKKIKIIDKR